MIIYNTLYKQQIIVNLILNLIFLFKGVLKMKENKEAQLLEQELDKVAGGKLNSKAKKRLRVAGAIGAMGAIGAAGLAAGGVILKKHHDKKINAANNNFTELTEDAEIPTVSQIVRKYGIPSISLGDGSNP